MAPLMSPDEYNHNMRVQELKPHVERAEGDVNRGPEHLRTLGDSQLQTHINNVDESIRRRTSISSLGTDKGHQDRIEHEKNNILAPLKAEQTRRDEAANEARRAEENNKLKGAPSLLPKGAGWGGPRK